MESVIKFDNFNINLQKLKDELSLIDDSNWHQHFSDLDEGWKAIPLISLDGKTDKNANKQGEGEIKDIVLRYKKTPILEKLPYFNEVLDKFKCYKLRTRIMRMVPGTNIEEHVDTQGWYNGIARMHYPIITHDEVYIFVNGKRVKMNEGEMWYMDVTKPHKLRNDSDVVRVHLVVDLVLNKFVRDFFPAQTLYDTWAIFYRRNKKAMFNFLRKTKLTEAFKIIKST